MKNITTNEQLRKKWNAKKVAQGGASRLTEPSQLALTRRFYFGDLPESRL